MDAALSCDGLLHRTESPGSEIGGLGAMLSAEPYDLEALTLLGSTLLDDGRPHQVLEAFARVLRFEPDHVGALFHRGVALARLRDCPAAVRVWDRVIQLQPSGQLATQARSRARSARDLQHILSAEG